MKSKLWFLILWVGCGGDGSSSIGVNVEDPMAFCRAVADMGCQAMYDCLTPDERAAKNLPATVGECERKLESGCEDAVESCNDGSHGYASAAADACLREMDAATCNDAAEPWLDAPSCTTICAPTAGRLHVKWGFNPPSYTCSALNVQTVAIYATGSDGRTYVDSFDCFALSGMTDTLPIGTYSVHLELFNYSNQKLWTSVAMNAKLDREVVDLGTVTIPVAQQ
jgi:hypothetical protein